MSEVRGTIQDGQVILDAPSDWPNGTAVVVSPLVAATPTELPDDADDSSGAIARRLALIERVQPWMSDEELAEWQKSRAEGKVFQLSQWDKWTKTAAEFPE